MTKTQLTLLQRIDQNPRKITTVIHGYRTCRKNGSYGKREFNAMISLRDQGIVKILKSESYRDCNRHYSDHWSEVVISRKIVIKENNCNQIVVFVTAGCRMGEDCPIGYALEL